VNPADEADVDRTVAEIKTLFAGFPWMPSAFRDLLNGKRFLPDNKLRPNLLNPGTGFMGGGEYREHFFGDKTLPELLRRAIADQVRYSTAGLQWRRRTRARLAGQTPGRK
jgi:FADH2 O2-dependent halogenase